MTPEKRLGARGLELPTPPAPIANFVPAVRAGNLVFLSGHGPNRQGGPQWQGKVGKEFDVDQARTAAEASMLNLLASLRAEIGELSRVRRVVKLLGMVNCTPDFGAQPQVINGASDLLVDLFGDRGRHARSAVGMCALPNNIPVEIEMIVELE